MSGVQVMNIMFYDVILGIFISYSRDLNTGLLCGMGKPSDWQMDQFLGPFFTEIHKNI